MNDTSAVRSVVLLMPLDSYLEFVVCLYLCTCVLIH